MNLEEWIEEEGLTHVVKSCEEILIDKRKSVPLHDYAKKRLHEIKKDHFRHTVQGDREEKEFSDTVFIAIVCGVMGSIIVAAVFTFTNYLREVYYS